MTRLARRNLTPALLALLLAPSVALADAPPRLPIQGVLADSDGVPIEDPIPVAFTLYADASGATVVFEETQTIDPVAGHFVAYLGEVAPLDWSVARDNDGLWLGIAVDGDPEMDLVPIATTPYAGWADHAGDAATLEGLDLLGVIGEAEASFGDALHERYTDEEAVDAMGDLGVTNPLNHYRYEDQEAITAMGDLSPDNPLNHPRYTDVEARAAMGTVTPDNPLAHDRYTNAEAAAAMGPKSNDNPLHHDRYTDGEAVAAMGGNAFDNPLHHDRFSAAEAVAAMGGNAFDNPLHHDRFTNAEAVAAMGTKANDNPLHHDRFLADEALAAVSAQDRYLLDTTDTLTGTLTVTDGIRDAASPATVRFVKMPFSIDDRGVITFTGADGTTHTLDTGAGQTESSHIVYQRAGSVAGDGILYFNIEPSPSGACTLLHNEDDAARPGWYFGTDAGNGKVAVWGNDHTLTFEIARAGEPGMPLPAYSSFAILCM